MKHGADQHKGSSKRQTQTHTGKGPHTITAKGPGSSSSRFTHNAGGMKGVVCGGGTLKKYRQKNPGRS